MRAWKNIIIQLQPYNNIYFTDICLDNRCHYSAEMRKKIAISIEIKNNATHYSNTLFSYQYNIFS